MIKQLKKFSDLPLNVQDYINQRFNNWGISGEEAFNHPGIFPDELRQMEPEIILEVLKNKEISHIMPVSKYPDLSDSLENVILEDERINQARKAEIMTDNEKQKAMDDLLADIKDGDFNEDGINDLETVLKNADEIEMLDIIGASLPIGLVLSGVQVFNNVKNNKIQLNDAPKWFLYQTGGKSIKLAFVGTMLATGSPIIVSGTIGYILFKSKDFIKRVFGGIYKGLVSDTAIKIYKGTGSIITSTGHLGFKAVKGTYDVATHKTTKKVVKKTSGMVWNGTKWVSKQCWEGTKETIKGAKWFSEKGLGFIKSSVTKIKKKK